MTRWSIPDQLSDGRVLLRPWQTSDAEWLLEGFNDPTVRAQTEHPDGLTVDSVEVVFDMVMNATLSAARGKGGAWAICRAADDEPVGNVELDVIEGCDSAAAIGFWVLTPHRNEGYASAAVKLAVDWAFASTSLTTVWADVDASNPASAAVLRAAAFTEPGGTELPPSMPARPTSLVLLAKRP